jgi:hypothetical protein
MKKQLATIAALVAVAVTTPAYAEQQQTQVTTRLIAVTEPEWITPDPRPECAFNDKGEYVHRNHPRDCSEQKHQGRRTERDWCGDLKNNPPDPAWCDAIWVKTQNTNHTSYMLRIVVTCVAFDRAGNTLGTGSSDDRPMHGDDLIVPAGKRPLQDANGDESDFRIERVKFAEVTRVNCWVSKVSPTTKTYDQILNDWNK